MSSPRRNKGRRPDPGAAKWIDRVAWVPPKYFQRTVIVAFQNWIASSGLPTKDRALVAVAVCQLAPRYNKYFDRARFLEACRVTEADLNAIAPSTIGEVTNGSIK